MEQLRMSAWSRHWRSRERWSYRLGDAARVEFGVGCKLDGNEYGRVEVGEWMVEGKKIPATW